MGPRWNIDHWLLNLHATLREVPSTPFTDYLQELATLFAANDLKKARTLLGQQEWKAYLYLNPPQHLAYFWFLYGRIYERSSDYKLAATAYQTCLDLFKEAFPKDMLGIVIIHFYLGQCEIDNANYRAAFKSCSIVIKYARSAKPLPLLDADSASFLAVNLLNRAKALPHLGSKSAAEVDLYKAFDLINTWVRSEREATYIADENEIVRFPLPNEGEYPFLLALTGIPAERLLVETQFIVNWAYLYNSVPWFYSFLMFWRYRDNPAAFTLPMQISYYQVIEQVAHNLALLPSQKIHVPRMYNLGAEIMLEICQNYEESPSDLQSRSLPVVEAVDTQTWLQKAELNIISAETILKIVLKDHALAEFGYAVPLMIQLSRLTWEFYSLILVNPVNWYANLLKLPSKIAVLLQKCEKADFPVLVGRCWFLMGRVMAETSRKETARQDYNKALELFKEGDGHLLLINEVKRAIERLDKE